MITGISGCRLGDGHLHLGHFNGCFRQDKLHGVDRYFFVIQDSSPAGMPPAHNNNEALIRLLSQVYAIASPIPITIVAQSSLFATYAELFDFFLWNTTLGLIEDTNPKKDTLLQRSGVVIKDYIFPIDQATQILSLGADSVIMNDDNLRFVYFARRIRNKLLHQYPSIKLARPELIIGPVPRVLGFNYKKMSKGNNNAILLLDDEMTITKKIKQCASFKWLYSEGVNFRIEHRSLGDAFTPPPTMPILILFRAFAESMDLARFGQSAITAGIIPDITDAVTRAVLKLTASIKDRSAALLSHPKVLWDRFEADQITALSVARSTTKDILLTARV